MYGVWWRRMQQASLWHGTTSGTRSARRDRGKLTFQIRNPCRRDHENQEGGAEAILKSRCQANLQGFMAASQTQAGPAALSTIATPPVDEKDEKPYRCQTTAEVKAYKSIPGVGAQKQKGEVAIYTNRLDRWKGNSTNFLLLSAFTRPWVIIPRTQVQLERTLSSAGQILTKARIKLDSDNLDVLVSLNHS